MDFEDDVHVSGIMNRPSCRLPIHHKPSSRIRHWFCTLPAAETSKDSGKLLVGQTGCEKKLEEITVENILHEDKSQILLKGSYFV